MEILLIDNYDSFTYNLAHDIRAIPYVRLTIARNNEISLPDIRPFDKIILSPGPGLPSQSQILFDVFSTFEGEKPILGVCLGLQAMYEAYGGTLLNLEQVRHGVSSEVYIQSDDDPLFANIDTPFRAGRYHSWVCNPQTLPDSLTITARDSVGAIMACRHRVHPIFGIQFHPESILTPEGKKMIQNFIAL